MSDLAPTKCSFSSSQSDNELPAPPIDVDRLLERCLGNLNVTRTLLNEFVTTSQSCLDGLDSGLADCNYAAISDKAHDLKGVAGVLMANTMKELSAKLEPAAKEADENQTRDLIQQLHHEIQRALDDIPSICALCGPLTD